VDNPGGSRRLVAVTGPREPIVAEVGKVKNIAVLLKEKGYRFTEQRQLVWNVMLENRGKHLSPKEIWENAHQKDPTLGIATVYRTIQILDELGVITGSVKKDEFNKYELSAEDEGCIRLHMICAHCGKMFHVAENLFARDPIQEIHSKYKFKIQEIRVKCYGVCDECAPRPISRSLGG
jgi:Fur family ferric uptake transcriptional regulator